MRSRPGWLSALLIASMALVGFASAAGRLLIPPPDILAYSTGYDIWVADLSRGLKFQLTRDQSRILDDSPSWSPDGMRLVYTTVRSYPFYPNQPNGEIGMIGLDRRGFRLLTRERAWDDAPAWSPDGRYIAFRSNRDAESGTAVYLIDLHAPDEPPRMVIADWLRGDLSPSWSPDGERLILHFTLGEILQVVSVDARTGATETLLPRAAFEPRISPDGLRVAVWMPVLEGYTLAVGLLGETPRALSKTHINPAPFAWSPDGAMIAFATTEDAVSMVRLIDTITGEMTVAFISPSRVSGIAWRP